MHFYYRPIIYAAFKLSTFLSNDRTNLFRKTRFINAETYSQRLEQEGRLDVIKKLIIRKKDLQFEQVENKPNILVITVSGLRYDALTSEKMPKLFEFATSSTHLRIITVAAIRTMPA